jgi:hypothetical protein
MEQILDRLLLSDLSEASDPVTLGIYRVQAILYFGDGGFFPEDIKLYHRPVGPGGQVSNEQLQDGVEFLRECLRTGRRVLVVGGIGATMISAYLIETGFSFEQALRLVAGGHSPRPDLTRLREHASELLRRAEPKILPVMV